MPRPNYADELSTWPNGKEVEWSAPSVSEWVPLATWHALAKLLGKWVSSHHAAIAVLANKFFPLDSAGSQFDAENWRRLFANLSDLL